MMFQSHHHAGDQVGRGLLGPFIIEPKKPTVTHDRTALMVVPGKKHSDAIHEALGIA
ncbi:MAG: hypothetical protein V2B17_03255 [Chloroflexota bacterium]